MGCRWTSIALPVAVVVGILWPGARGFADGLQEVIVTAQKRDQREQDVPLTMTVIKGETLLASGTKDLLQLANYVPGMVFSRAPDDGLALSFRGVGTPARTQALDQSVAFFLDGLFLAKSRLYSQALFDVDQIEFTKGTQGTVLGKNASVGTITIVSREPGRDFGGEPTNTVELGVKSLRISRTRPLRVWRSSPKICRCAPRDSMSTVNGK